MELWERRAEAPKEEMATTAEKVTMVEKEALAIANGPIPEGRAVLVAKAVDNGVAAVVRLRSRSPMPK